MPFVPVFSSSASTFAVAGFSAASYSCRLMYWFSYMHRST